MKKIVIVVFVLSALLIGAVGYIGYNIYVNARYTQQVGIYNQGYNVGAGETISQIVQVADACQVVPLRVNENRTINLVAAKCLPAGCLQ